MPFRVKWSDSARADFRLLQGQGIDTALARQVIGSRPHDYWLQGQAYELEGLSDVDVRMLDNDGLRVVYQFSVEAEFVEIVMIRRSL